MNTVSSQLSAKPLLSPLPGTHPPQSLSRQKREAPAPAESAEGSRLQGDRELAMEYHSALLKLANGEKDVTINAIAPDSTFGQWWAHLRDTFKSPEVRQWMEDQGINPGSITLNLQSGRFLSNADATLTQNRSNTPLDQATGTGARSAGRFWRRHVSSQRATPTRHSRPRTATSMNPYRLGWLGVFTTSHST